MPLPIEPDEREQIVSYLLEEAERAFEERAGTETKWAKWQRQREARPEFEVKNRPWPRASNVAVPAAAIATSGITSSLKQAFGDRVPFWTFEGPVPEQEPAYNSLTDFVEDLVRSPFHINWKEMRDPFFYDLASMGTKFAKVIWQSDSRQVKVQNPDGTVSSIEVQLRAGPRIIPIPIHDFVSRAHFDDVQAAPWIMHVVHHTWQHLKEMEFRGAYDTEAIESIQEWYDTHRSETQQTLDEQDQRWGLDPKWGDGPIEAQTWRLYEFWLDWILEGDEVASAIKILLEPNSRTVLVEDFNDLGGIRPFVRVPYIVREGRLYAMGVGWMAEGLQDEIDTHHNMRVDANHLTTSPMLIARKHGGISPKETVRPGKIWFVDNPGQDLSEIALRANLNDSLASEALAQQYLDRWTGMNDAMLGFGDTIEKTRASVGGRAMQIQQGGKRFRGIIEGIEPGLSALGTIVFYQLVKHRQELDLSMYGPDKQSMIMESLNMRLEDIPKDLRVRVKTTDVEETEDAKKQSLLMIVQLQSQYWQLILQAAMMAENPQVPSGARQIATEQIVSMTTRMREILMAFDEDFINKKLPDIRRWEQVLIQAQMRMAMINAASSGALQGAQQNGFPITGGVPLQRAGGGPPSPPNGAGGVEGIPAAAQGAFGGQPRPNGAGG